MYQPLANGGIYVINFATMVKSLRLAWISRILNDTNDLLKAIPNFFFFFRRRRIIFPSAL